MVKSNTGEMDHLITTDDAFMNKTLSLSAFTIPELYLALKTRIAPRAFVFGEDPIATAEDAIRGLMQPNEYLSFKKFNEKAGNYGDSQIQRTASPESEESTYYSLPSDSKFDPEEDIWFGMDQNYGVRQIIFLNYALWEAGVEAFPDDTDWNYTKEAATELIDAIQASPEGCLTFTSSFDYNFLGCTESVTPTFKLYLYDRGYQRPVGRRLVDDAPPIIASRKASLPNGLEVGGPDDASDIGSYTPRKGDYRDSVTGKLHMHYEPNTGEWESGTTNILARLLTDLEAVTINQLDPTTVDGQDDSDFSRPDSSSNTSNYSVGEALPLSVHKGNPHLFMPTWVNKECEGNKKHKIQVTNRAGRSFKVGDLVMCFHISGEWHVMDFGSEPEGGPGSFMMGKWSFMNMIADRRAFFRDNRYYEQYKAGDTPTGAIASMKSPTQYEAFFRENWFYQLYKDNDTINEGDQDFFLNNYKQIAKWNAIGGTFDPDTEYFDKDVDKEIRNFQSVLGGYYQQSSFDLLDKALGGVHHFGNMIGRTNLTHKPDGNIDGANPIQKQDFFPFWGATFPDGYSSTKIKALKGKYTDMLIGKHGFDVDNTDSDWQFGVDYFITGGHTVNGMFNTDLNKNKWGDSQGIWGNVTQYGLQLPADVALLASPAGENGYGMESFARLKDWCSFGEHTNILDTMRYNLPLVGQDDKKGLGSKFNWLSIMNGGEIEDSLYDFSPLKPNRIEFKPLWADYVGSLNRSNTFECSDGVTEAEKYFKHARQDFSSIVRSEGDGVLYWNRTFSDEGDGYWEGLVSPAFCNRIVLGNINNYDNHHDLGATLLNKGIDLPGFSLDTEEQAGQTVYVDPATCPTDPWRGVPYGQMIRGGQITSRREDSEQNAGNIVGMTIAKAKITAKATQLSFTTNQHLGLVIASRFGTGTGDSSQTVSADPRYTYGYVGESSSQSHLAQWGTINDTPWGQGSFGTTALHGRLCAQWPDEDTLLDPRYFAVMHFNPQGGIYLKSDGDIGRHDTWKQSNEGLKLLGQAKDDADWTVGDLLPEFNHPVGLEYTSVDFRVPTWVDSDSSATVVPVDSLINGDNYVNGVLDGDTDGTVLDGKGKNIFLEPSDWLFNPVRRGQLLPFIYPKRVVGIHSNTLDAASRFVAKSMGENFEEGDLITTDGGSGTGVEIIVKKVDNGKITEWEFTEDKFGNLNMGEGFLPQDFATQDIDPAAFEEGGREGSVILVKKTGSGTGLDYRYNRGDTNNEDWVTLIDAGIVIDKKGEDEGPQKGEIQQLSMRSQGAELDSVGRAVGSHKESISLPLLKAGTTDSAITNGKYDLFLLFHSDVQHYLRSYDIRGAAAAQFCTLEISTLS